MKGKSCSLTRTPYTVLLVLTVLLLLPGFTGASLAQEITGISALQWVGDIAEITSPTTVRTRVVIGQEEKVSNQGVWLAGFATEPNGSPTALAVTFAQSGAGWLGPMWGLQLQSNQGLIPRRMVPQAGAGFLQDATFLSLQSRALDWGHEYEITLGYDPKTGAASLSVYDVTTETWTLTRNLQLEPFAGKLYPAAGVGTTAREGLGSLEPIASIETLEVEPRLLPAPFSWWIMQRDRPEQPFTSVQRLDRRNEAAVSVHLPWVALPGDVRLRLVNEAGATLSTVTGIEHDEHIPIPLEDLPGGVYQAVLEYVDAYDVWALDERSIVVGVLNVAIESAVVTEQTADEATITGRLRVTSDGPLGTVAIGLTGDIIRHAFVFEPDGRTGQTERVSTGSVTVLAAHSLGTDADGLIEFQGTVPVPVVENDEGWELKIEPFSLPDQYMVAPPTASVWLVEPTSDLPWLGFLDYEHVEFTQWVPGVDVIHLNGELPVGPLNMHLVVVDVSRPEITIDALVGSGFETVGSRWPRGQIGNMVLDAGAVLGINAAFFDIRNTMNPSGLVIQSGQLLKSGATNAIGFDAEGKPYMGLWQWQGTVRRSDGTASRALVGLNETNMGAGLGLYRWPATRTPGAATPEGLELIVTELVDEDDPTEGSTHRLMRGVVADVRQGQPPIPLEPGMAVLGGAGLNANYLLDTYAVGDEVEIAYRLLGNAVSPHLADWRDLRSAASGGVVLVRNGQYGDAAVRTNRDRHPRTAVGISRDQKTFYMLAVDGRSVDSVGVTYEDMAQFFLHLGAYHALNLDGGGSTTLAGRDIETDRIRILNIPSDGGQRYVPDGLAIFYDAQ